MALYADFFGFQRIEKYQKMHNFAPMNKIGFNITDKMIENSPIIKQL